MSKTEFSSLFRFVFLYLILITEAHSFWPLSSKDEIKKHENYFHTPCQQFNSDELGKDPSITCVESYGGNNYTQALMPLVELDKKLSKKQAEDELLKDVALFVEKKVDENLASVEFIRSCLRDTLRKRAVHQDCSESLMRIRQSTYHGLPLLREHMSLMDFPQPLRGLERNSRSPGLQVRYYQEKIKHPNSSVVVPELDEREKKQVEQYVETLREKMISQWYQQKVGTTRCVKKRENGDYFFDGTTCEKAMSNQLAQYIDRQFRAGRERHQKDYQSLIQAAPHLAYINKGQFQTEEELDEGLLVAFDNMFEEIKKDRDKLKLEDSSSRTSLFRYPSLINSYFAQKDPLKELQCSVAQGIHQRHGPGGLRDMLFDIGVGIAAVVGGVTCAFTAGIGCAVGVAVLSEGYFLGSSSLKLWESERLFQMQLIQHQELEDSRDQRNMAILFAPLSLTGFHSAQVINRGHLPSVAISQSRVLRRDLDLLKSEYVNFHATTPVQNRLWIESARSGKAKLYFDLENAAMKRLNDTLGDKNFVTAATNLHKKIFQEKFEKLKAKYPKLKVQTYSDFKSLRLSFDGDIPAQLRDELNNIFQETNQEFSRQLKSLNGVQLGTENPENWFNAGMGLAADQAGLASRFARSAHRDGLTARPVVNYHTIKQELSQNLLAIESQRSSLHQSFSGSEGLKIFERGPRPVLKLEAIELLRKNAQTSSQELANLFKRNFNIEMTEAQAAGMQRYLNSIDQFSPGLWQEQRVVANLDLAQNGGLSVDFKGLGAKNLQQLARDLGDNANNIDQAIDAARKGEAVVTEILSREKLNYQNLVNSSLHRHGVTSTNHCSGDDCVSLLDKAIDLQGQRDIVSSFATAPKPSDYRLSFIPPGVRAEHRTNLAVHGELIEKEIRKKITGFGDGLIPPHVLEKVNFAVVMPNEIGQGKVRVLAGVANDVELTPAQSSAIQGKLSEVLRSINQQLSEVGGSSVRYQADVIEIISP